MMMVAVSFSVLTANAQTKILFDCTKAETAGNADWIIDADLNNLYWGPYLQYSGSESNAQRIPTPAQTGINTNTVETYWTGGLSNWAVDCAKQGFIVESLPANGQITFGSSTNVSDLSHYSVFIVCEPNLPFSPAEKTAIWNYVQSGGSLFMISDHDQSDRNGDGMDSPAIWNDLLSGTNVGITFNIDDFSGYSTLVVNSGVDSISNGRYGSATQVEWADGTDMTINTTVNPNVRPVFYRYQYNNDPSHVLFAYATYGSGKIAAIGDSSPCDDGTGDVNDFLYNGYTLDANGNHQKLLMNATIWLTKNTITNINSPEILNDKIYVYNNTLRSKSTCSSPIFIYDLTGKELKSFIGVKENETYSLEDLSNGIYIVRCEGSSKLFTITK